MTPIRRRLFRRGRRAGDGGGRRPGAAAGGRRRHAALRRRGRARQRQLHPLRGGDPRPDRPERRRQDHLLQRDDRRLPARPRARSGSSGQHDQRPEAHQITQMGIARTFQNIRLFPEMTALENVHGRRGRAPQDQRALGALFRLPRHRREEREGREKARAACWSSSASPTGPHELARNLPYGDQRRLEIARALATDPSAALPGRAGRRLQPGGEGGADGADPARSATPA